MTVTQLIATLSQFPPDAIVRVFSTEDQDWMPLNNVEYCTVIGVGDRIDLQAMPQDDDEDEDEDPMGATYCERCANPLESGQIGLCDNCQN